MSAKNCFPTQGPRPIFSQKKMYFNISAALQKHFFSGPNKVLLYGAVMFPIARAENENMTAPYEST
jgi:hypothetical protein